jgi:hypothetical protein
VITVVVVSSRAGGYDVLRSGLREQTCGDFEVIVVDEIKYHRQVEVSRVADVAPSLYVDAPWGNYMHSLNVALRAARGDRLVFWSDYTCPHPETLATHARFHETNPDDVMLGGIEYTALPKLHPGFPLRYGWLAMGYDMANPKPETYAPWLDDKRRHELYEEWRVAYERDLADGTLAPFMWSTFERPISSFADTDGLRILGYDKRDTSPFLNLKNDSIPLSLLEKIGGFDERADGCHGHQDSITARQLAKVGAKFVSVPENPVRLLDPHNLMIIRRMERPDTSNLELYEELAR